MNVNNQLKNFPIDNAILLIRKKWVVQIINDLFFGKTRFHEFKENKPKLSNRVLSSCLKEMEEDGLIVREEYDVLPPKVEYYLTDIGYTLRPVIESMHKWGKEYKRLRKLMERYKS